MYEAIGACVAGCKAPRALLPLYSPRGFCGFLQVELRLRVGWQMEVHWVRWRGRERKGPQLRVGLSWNAHSQEAWACRVPVAAHAAGGSGMQARSSRAASPGSFAQMRLPCTCAMRRTVACFKSPYLSGVQILPRSSGVQIRA